MCVYPLLFRELYLPLYILFWIDADGLLKSQSRRFLLHQFGVLCVVDLQLGLGLRVRVRVRGYGLVLLRNVVLHLNGAVLLFITVHPDLLKPVLIPSK